MKLHRIIILSVFLVFITENISSQTAKPSIHSIDSLLEYKVINPEMGKAIDNLLLDMKDCFYYSVLNNPFLITVRIYDTSWFSVISIPYSTTLINYRRLDPRVIEEGFCNYKGYTVLISSLVPNYMNHFFESTNKKSNLYYENSENIADHIFPWHESVELIFDYINNKIVLEGEKEDFFRCKNTPYFCYIVQQGDTWQDIATKCGCPIEKLTDGSGDAEIPIPGYLVVVEYLFKNGKLANTVRVQ